MRAGDCDALLRLTVTALGCRYMVKKGEHFHHWATLTKMFCSQSLNYWGYDRVIYLDVAHRNSTMSG